MGKKKTDPLHASEDVEQFGTLLFWVSSRSRPGLRHLVDLAGESKEQLDYEQCEFGRCTCEDAQKHNNPLCKHVIACVKFLIPELILVWKPSRIRKLMDLIEDRERIRLRRKRNK